MKFAAAYTLLLTCFSVGIRAQTDGTITGRVVDDAGKPVASVKMDISDRGKIQIMRIHGRSWTGADGTFSMQHIPWGTYVIETSKREEGYAENWSAFYGDRQKMPTVTVSSVLPSQDLTIVLGPKAGVLDASAVVDAVTGAHVDAALTLRRVDNGSGIITSTTVKNILVPSATPVTLEISAPGYSTWYYPGTTDASKGGTLSLQPEQRMEIPVALQPMAK